MDLTVVGYLLFIIPGFCLVWTYRHFTKAKQIGEFEYAAWSFLWGSVMFFSTAKILELRHVLLPPISTNNPLLFAAAILGVGLTTVLALAFPFGYIGALFSRAGLFSFIDKLLFRLIEKLTGKKDY